MNQNPKDKPPLQTEAPAQTETTTVFQGHQDFFHEDPATDETQQSPPEQAPEPRSETASQNDLVQEADPEEADPEEADPEEADPEEADPEDADPEDADPEDADPEDADPEDADPEDADPDIQPKPAPTPEPEPEPEPEPNLTVSLHYQEDSKTVIAVKRPDTDPYFTAHPNLLLEEIHQKILDTIKQADRHWILNPKGQIHTKPKSSSNHNANRNAKTPAKQEGQQNQPASFTLTGEPAPTAQPIAMTLFDMAPEQPADKQQDTTSQAPQSQQDQTKPEPIEDQEEKLTSNLVAL